MSRVLLIHPPVAKPGEPPAGIARLKGFLEHHGVSVSLIDANLEGLFFLLDRPVSANDRWTFHAVRNRNRHVSELHNGDVFKSNHHYNRIVRDLNRLIQYHGRSGHYQLGLADCTHDDYSPLKSEDLIRCAEQFDTNPFYPYFKNELLNRIEEASPELIGLSVNFLSQALCAFALMGFLRNYFPRATLVLGGGLVTSWMRNPVWKPVFQEWVDHCVEGPGESFFSTYFEKETIQDSIRMPDYDTLPSLPYLSPGFILPYSTSTGCYWRQCRFCPECAEQNPYRPVPHVQVVEELHALTERTDPVLIHFLDNALSSSFLRLWTEASQGVPWYGYVRFNDELMNPKFCEALKASGCRMLKLGLESGSQDVLDRMHKGNELHSVRTILKNLRKAGIAAFVYLLFGTPYESEEEAHQTLNFVIRNHACIGFINAAIFNMPASGPDTGTYRTRPFNAGDLSLYVDFDHPEKWDRLKVRRFLDREFRREPVIAAILNRTPKIFTSNHAPFVRM